MRGGCSGGVIGVGVHVVGGGHGGVKGEHE